MPLPLIAVGLGVGAAALYEHAKKKAATTVVPTPPPPARPVFVTQPTGIVPPKLTGIGTDAAAVKAQGGLSQTIDTAAHDATTVITTAAEKLPVVGTVIAQADKLVNALPVPDVVKDAIKAPVVAINAAILKVAAPVVSAIVDLIGGPSIPPPAFKQTVDDVPGGKLITNTPLPGAPPSVVASQTFIPTVPNAKPPPGVNTLTVIPTPPKPVSPNVRVVTKQ